MWWTWISLALGGEVVLDAKGPARLVIDGVVAAELHRAGIVRMEVPDGQHTLVVTVDGAPHTWTVVAKEGPPIVVLAGRGGVTLEEAPATVAVATEPVDVRIMPASGDRLMVQIDHTRLVLPPEGTVIQLTPGDHPVSVRSSDGTSVYARGVLAVRGGQGLVFRVAEGALPETAGEGIRFVADPR